MSIKIITIIGARPQIIKSAAISRAISTSFSNKINEIIVHTGQHYDENMSDVFFGEMNIPRPKYNLEVGSGTHGKMTAKMIDGLETIFMDEKPNGVLVYGDTNSTIAGALAAAKLHIPVVHVEAGLRSFNKRMPEEINRIACDHMSTLLFTPTKVGVDNLKNEGFEINRQTDVGLDNPGVYLCGDIMFDNSLFYSKVSDKKSTIIRRLNIQSDYILCTIHRDSNTDVPGKLESIFTGLLNIQAKSGFEIILPLHPRTLNKMQEVLTAETQKKIEENTRIKLIEPAGFLDIIALEKNARMIVTDSGGLQKESYFFKKPCLVLRPETEWVEIVETGNARLVDTDVSKMIDAFDYFMTKENSDFPVLYGDGKAAEFICEQIIKHL